MKLIRKSIDIDAPVDRVLTYAVDPTRTSEWLSSLLNVRNVTGTGVGQRSECTYRRAGVPLRGESMIIAHVRRRRAVCLQRLRYRQFLQRPFELHQQRVVQHLHQRLRVRRLCGATRAPGLNTLPRSATKPGTPVSFLSPPLEGPATSRRVEVES